MMICCNTGELELSARRRGARLVTSKSELPEGEILRGLSSAAGGELPRESSPRCSRRSEIPFRHWETRGERPRFLCAKYRGEYALLYIVRWNTWSLFASLLYIFLPTLLSLSLDLLASLLPDALLEAHTHTHTHRYRAREQLNFFSSPSDVPLCIHLRT